MNKFKVGDKVRCINDVDIRVNVRAGDILTVTAVQKSYLDENAQIISLYGVGSNLYSDRFELVQEPARLDLELTFPFGSPDGGRYYMDASRDDNLTTDTGEQAICGAMLEVGREIGALERKVDRAQFLQKSSEDRVGDLLHRLSVKEMALKLSSDRVADALLRIAGKVGQDDTAVINLRLEVTGPDAPSRQDGFQSGCGGAP